MTTAVARVRPVYRVTGAEDVRLYAAVDSRYDDGRGVADTVDNGCYGDDRYGAVRDNHS